MVIFLKKLEEKITLMEKFFDEDVKRNASLNKLLYEYEEFSIKAYGINQNKDKKKKKEPDLMSKE